MIASVSDIFILCTVSLLYLNQPSCEIQTFFHFFVHETSKASGTEFTQDSEGWVRRIREGTYVVLNKLALAETASN